MCHFYLGEHLVLRSLMGVDEGASSMLPKWKRGHFSVLFNGATQPSAVYLVDWAARTFVDVQKEKKKAKQPPDAEARRPPTPVALHCAAL